MADPMPAPGSTSPGALADTIPRSPFHPFPAARFHLHGLVERGIHFTDFAGSALRGAFGHALRRAACVTGQPECPACPLYRRCAYPAIFQPPPPLTAHRAYSKVQPPYVIEPPAPGPLTVQPGKEFRFGLVLIGPAIHKLPLVAGAFRHALKDIDRGSVQLRRIVSETGALVMDLATMETSGLPSRTLTVPPAPAQLTQARLQFSTPFALARNGKELPVRDITARELLMSLVRRTAELSEVHLGQALDVDFRQLAQATAAIAIDADLRPLRFNRYSSRQHRSIAMAGSLGSITLRGDLTPFWPFLHLGQWLHVGKKCPFGFGRYLLHC